MANKSLIIKNSSMSKELKALGLLMCTAQEYQSRFDKVLKPLGVSTLQLHILHELSHSENGSLTVNQVKDLMVEDSPNISRALNKLMSNGLIEKIRSKKDQRVVYIRLTEEGSLIHDKGDSVLCPLQSLNLKEDDVALLFDLLKKLG
ncbi:MarR family winged helix-turn-helix transcriptional regulator [Aureibacter tunicatorum]|uniref:DNA-binding MarR family transcriptional regulator n=1 Tax=Aureibacter tunicatorum TaxID=866807 RepID=A0AAE3XTP9_9BACT|nr:MarR family transcriptional regulator [Aureibacter tunicatorum]MDR6241830.1 DNA-binding MarR family transcriptional regulator [Aureibacter tunicatorum]BDD07077.1 hypothetical protein AUTU_45600 [Aureibacter tunicatorum]